MLKTLSDEFNAKCNRCYYKYAYADIAICAEVNEEGICENFSDIADHQDIIKKIIRKGGITVAKYMPDKPLEPEEMEPEASEPLHTCEWCQQDIFVGDTFYRILGEIVCEDCITKCSEEALYEEPEYNHDLDRDR